MRRHGFVLSKYLINSRYLNMVESEETLLDKKIGESRFGTER